MTTPLQDAAALLTSTDRAVLIVATHATEGPEYTVTWSGDEYTTITDVNELVGAVRTDMSLARNRTAWPEA